MREARLHRIRAAGPDDVFGILSLAAQGTLDPHAVVAVLGKTEGNGLVNDFTRGFATASLTAAFSRLTGLPEPAIAERIVFVMSGGTEGGLSPHWLVFEIHEARAPGPGHALAIGTASTRPLLPHELGRGAQVDATATATRSAMAQAGIDRPEDVHYVQVKCPLLTRSRIEASARDGFPCVTDDTLKSMTFSRGASALGVALALGELDAIPDGSICRDASLFSSRAATSAGIELLGNQVLVLGNSPLWSGDLAIAHGLMADAIDTQAVVQVLAGLGLPASLPPARSDRARIAAVLAKAEASRSGTIRGSRHTMLDDSDVSATRHARALVGGVLAGALGITELFVSGGSEHQGPEGGGPLAIIARST